MKLYPYQKLVSEYLLAGQSVILQAPTGAGKTTAALLPFLHGRQNDRSDFFPRKCIYSVPMRVLANQFHKEYKNIIRESGWEDRLNISIQTGDRPDDRKLESDLIFTTIDQTLSNFLNIPYALGSGSANLNAGALISSYLVFDELHLFDPDTMLPTVLDMLQMLRKVTPFVIMTATFSSQMLDRLASLLDAVVVPKDAMERSAMESIGSQVGKKRYFHTVDSPLTAEYVLDHREKRIICICNTVRSAQTLYRSLTEQLSEQGDSQSVVCLIHARFYKGDRDAKEEWIRENFGTSQSDYQGPPLILISTQVIEVGVDATCDVMHTEIAPASSILQRAGRCARRTHETGHVYVYLPRDAEGEPDYTPYFLKSKLTKTQRGRQLCEATWLALNSDSFQEIHMGFEQEQALIDQVHAPVDQEILDEIKMNQIARQKSTLRTMQEQESSMAAELIRESDSRFVVVHPEPNNDEHLRRNPWYYDGFSLQPGTIASAFKMLQEEAYGSIPLMQWACKKQINIKDRGWEEKPEGQHEDEYQWTEMSESGEVYSSPAIAIHPAFARYSFELGFEFGLSLEDEYPLVRRPGTRPKSQYNYRRETYAEHVAGLYRAYQRTIFDPDKRKSYLPLKDEIAYAVKRLENTASYKLRQGQLDQLLRGIFACHDLGKLSKDWQAWAHRWQRQLGRFYDGQDMSLTADYMAAHTDYEPTDEQKKAQKKIGKRPHHAGESAMATCGLLIAMSQSNKNLCSAAITAITRHHNAATDSYQPFDCHPLAKQAFVEGLDAVGLEHNLAEMVWYEPDGQEILSRLLVQFDRRNLEEIVLYFLLIRVLRLADQRSQITG